MTVEAQPNHNVGLVLYQETSPGEYKPFLLIGKGGAPAILEAELDDAGALVIPSEFDMNFSLDAQGNAIAMWFTDGTNTWTKTITRDGNGNITKISQPWAKS